MKHLEDFLNKFLAPVANFMNQNKFFSTLSEAFMRLTPITLGGAVVLLVGNFPIQAWLDFLNNTGISQHVVAAQNATMNILGMLIAFTFAYFYVKKSDLEPLSAGMLSLASFLVLMPQTFDLYQLSKVPDKFPAQATVTAKDSLSAFATQYTGATGIIVAILVGWCVGVLYVFLTKKKIVIKLPDSVPANVSESLKPSILSGIILILAVVVRIIFKFAVNGDIFTTVGNIIQIPLQNLISSPFTYIIFTIILNVLWFFGIHPSTLNGVLFPFVMATLVANQNAYIAGKELPYFTFGILGCMLSSIFGGTGNMLGLVIAMMGAKSERYKQLRKLAALPALFNINEPLVFGVPVMMNPIFFLPMVLMPIAISIVTYLSIIVLHFTRFNPLIQLPWTTPGLVVTFLQGGIKFFIISVLGVAVSILVWTPFFIVADKRALAEEQENM